MLNLRAFLSLDGSGFETGIKRAQSSADKFATSVGKGISSRLAGFLSGAAVEETIRRTIDYAGRVNDLSQRLEISTDAVQQWEHAVSMAGGKAEQVASFFEKLSEAREKALSGDAGAIRSFANLGVSNSDLKTKRIEDIGLQIGNAVKEGDAQKLISSLRDVGGRSAGAMVAAFKSGLAASFAEAPLIKTEDIIRLDALGDEVATIGKRLMAGIAPVITFLGKALLSLFDDIQLRVGPIFATLGALAGGSGIKGALVAGAESARAIINEQSERDKRAAQLVKEASGRGAGRFSGSSAGGRISSGASESASNLERSIAQPSNASINALQQIGARVNSSPMQNSFQTLSRELQNATSAIKELTATTKAAQTLPQFNDMGGVRYQ